MTLLADQLGYVQLAQPARFRASWEQAASLRLRAGDVSVLADYDQHGRIQGGDPERMVDASVAAYIALTVDGTDTLLMAADHSLRRELSRRIRDDLIHLGIVEPGPAARIADGATASPGDLIVCTRNDHSTEAGEPGRTLANGDLLRVDSRHPRRPDRPPGARCGPGNRAAPLDRPSLRVRQLRNCRTGLRGHRPRRAGPHRAHRPGGHHRHRGPPARLRRPDPRHPHQHRLRIHPCPPSWPTRRPARARPPNWPATTSTPPDSQPDRTSSPEPAGTRDALGVLADVLDRDGQQLSATQTWQQALADADHLAILHAIWAAETTPARDQRYQDLLLAALPRGYRQEPGHQARWLWRTLRAAELAGLDLQQVLAGAVGERPADRRPRRAVRDRRPAPAPHRRPHPAPGRPVVRAAPRHPRPGTPRLRRRGRRGDGRPQGSHRRARRRQCPPVGGRRPRPGPG